MPHRTAALPGLLAVLLLLHPDLALGAPVKEVASIAGFTFDKTDVRATFERGQLGLRLPYTCSDGCSGSFTVALHAIDGRLLGQRAAPALPRGTPDPAIQVTLPLRLGEAQVELAILRVSYQDGGQRLQERIALHRVLDAPRLWLSGPASVVPGRRARFRVLAVRSRSGTPIPRGEVTATLQVPGAPPVVQRGLTSDGGTFGPTFDVPAGAGGKTLRLQVHVRTPLGERRSEVAVRAVEKVRVLLVTDKPIYQPGQTLHLRTLTHRSPTGGALANASTTFEVRDGRDNLVFRQTAPTDAYGIAHARFALADRVNQGRYRVLASVAVPGGAPEKVERTVRVFTYRLPKFKIRPRLDRGFYRPGGQLSGEVYVWYGFGKPVQGAQVELDLLKEEVGETRFARVTGRTNQWGAFAYQARLPDHFMGQPLDQGRARVILRFKVREPGGEERTAEATVPVVQHAIRVAVVPERAALGELAGPHRFLVLTSLPDGAPAPATVTIRPSEASLHLSTTPAEGAPAPTQPQALSLRTDAQGVGELFLTQRPIASAGATLTLEAQDAQGQTGQLRYPVPVRLGDRVAPVVRVRPARSLYRVGERLEVEVLTSLSVAYAYVDLVRSGQTVETHEVALTHRRGRFATTLSPDHTGVLLLSVYAHGLEGEPVRDVRPILVQPADELRVAVTTDKKVYAPGQPATITFDVTDGDGRPTPAALGVWIIDQAVYTLAEMQPGLARVFFRLEQELLRPRVSHLGWAPASLLVPPVDLPARQRQARAADVLLTAAAHPAIVGLLVDGAVAHRLERDRRLTRAARPALAALATRLAAAIQRYLEKPGHDCWSPEEEDLVREKLWPRTAPRDPWGNEIRWSLELDHAAGGGYRGVYQLTVRSAGPNEQEDAEPGQGDDLSLTTRVIVPRCRRAPIPRRRSALEGLFDDGPSDWSAGEAMSADASPPREPPPARPGPPGRTAAEPVRVRRHFPEALHIDPALITDGRGRATVSLRLADSITTWKLAALASTTDGRIGSAEAGIPVFTPFFVDVSLPPELTRGDEITVPVALHNYARGVEEVKVTLRPAPWYRLARGPGEQTVRLGAGEVKAVPFVIRAERVGTFRLEVTARGRQVADAIERAVAVRPDGRRVELSAAGGLDQPFRMPVTVPAGAVPDSARLVVQVMPGALAAAVEGLESMLSTPHGCFEQTSSTTYPNVLILQYLKAMRRTSPELALRARHLVGLGYQRLVTFEVTGGGFSLFGHAPADVALTAYGLHEFVDMAEVYPVDPGLVPRTRRFLLSAQQRDGSFSPRPSYFIYDEPTREDRVRVTAYTAWALIRAGERGAAITRALAYVKANLAARTDAYTLAIVASLLVAKDRAHPWLPDVLRRLPAPTPQGGRGAFWSLGEGATITHSAGRPGDVETTALLAAALLRSGRLPYQSRQALAFLVGAKAPRGGWGSTQANVLALQALLAAQRAAAQAAVQGKVEVLLDGQVVGEASLTEAGAGVVHAIDASARLRAGQTQQLMVRWSGKGVPLVQVVGSYHLPDDLAPRPRPLTSRLELSVSYDRKELRTRDTVTVRARLANRTAETAVMPMIDLGKPAGFDPVTEDLEQLVKQGRIAQFEVQARQIVLYLAQLRGSDSVTLSFRLRARFPLRVTAPASSAYEYYHEAARAESGPAILTVR